MLLDNGDVILVSHRRMFQHDEARFFVGRTVACDRELVKLEGFSFVRDLSSGHVIRKDEMRVKLLSLASPGYIFYQLPDVKDVSKVHVEDQAGDVTLMDGKRALMNLSERSHCGHI
jgi:hypothetical protein